MSITISIHLAVNNSNGVHTGYCDAIEMYGGAYDLEPLISLRGDAIPCGVHREFDYYALQIGDGVYQAQSYREYVGNLIWDSARISLADAVHVINGLRKYGWTWDEGSARLFYRFTSDQDIGEADLTAAMVVEATDA